MTQPSKTPQDGNPELVAVLLVDQREPVELGARNGHLEMVACSRAILDRELLRAGKRPDEQLANRLGLHRGHASCEG